MPERNLPPHHSEAEEAVLGSVLLDREVVARLSTTLVPSDFYHERHGIIWTAMLALYERDEPVDYLTLIEELDRTQRLQMVGGTTYVANLLGVVPTPINAAEYARIVAGAAAHRRLISVAGKVAGIGFRAEGSPEDSVRRSEQLLASVLRTEQAADFVKMDDASAEYMEELNAKEQARLAGLTGTTYAIPTGYRDIDRALQGGLGRSDLIVMAGRPGMGKAQPLDARVLTSDGWKDMGDLRVGEEIASLDGGRSSVESIHPQGVKQVYRVTFSDGRSAECCDDHLWKVMYRDWVAPRVLTTAKLREMLTKARYRRRLWIEAISGDFGHTDPVPVDPWLLGMLLGDGCLTGGTVRFTSADAGIVERARRAVGDGLEVRKSAASHYEYTIVSSAGPRQKGVFGLQPSSLRSALGTLGAWGCRAWEKSVPLPYMTASRSVRLGVLQGLLDTDGWVERHGSVCFISTSEQLAKDVQYLARSIGAICTDPTPRQKYACLNGVRTAGRMAYGVTISTPNPAELFTLERKRLAARATNRTRLHIMSIEPSRVTETQCITVSHPDHTYITDDFVVTHNSGIAMEFARRAALGWGVGVAVFSLEMATNQLVARMFSVDSGIPLSALRRAEVQERDAAALGASYSRLQKARIWFDDSSSPTVEQIRSRVRRLARTESIDLVIIDHIQILAGSQRGVNRVQELTEISRALKALAKDENIAVLALSQLSRAVDHRPDKRPNLSDLRESGSIEQDADVVLLLYRESYYNEDSERRDQLEVIVAKHRNGPTGTEVLFWAPQTTGFLGTEVFGL